MNGRPHFTTQAQFTSSGVWCPSKSWPDKRKPFSRRSGSRARMGAPRGRRNEIDRHAGKGPDAAQVHGRETLKEIRGARTLQGQAEPLLRAIRESDLRTRVSREP